VAVAGQGGARNRMLASLPKPALVSNRKVLSEHRCFLTDHARSRRKETYERYDPKETSLRLLDRLVGERKQLGRHLEAERFCGP
jgi:hypothetical protein